MSVPRVQTASSGVHASFARAVARLAAGDGPTRWFLEVSTQSMSLRPFEKPHHGAPKCSRLTSNPNVFAKFMEKRWRTST